MARPAVDNNKYMAVRGLNEGDLIQLTTGEKVLFERCKQKDFLGIMENGKRYSIFINKFDKIIEKVNITARQISSNSVNKEMQVRNLRPGDKVKLTNGDVAEFVKANQKRFIGIMSGSRFTIPFGMFDSVVSKDTQAITKKQPKKDSGFS